MEFQSQIVMLDNLVSQTNVYRKIKKAFDFDIFRDNLSFLETSKTYTGFGVYRLFLCILLQYIEDLSDRELEQYLENNLSAKWFCGFDLDEKTPKYSIFSKFRDRLGVNKMTELFNKFTDNLKSAGYINEVFTFVDASHLISKSNLWRERDEIIAQKYEQLNNQNISKVARDKEARIGCKGGSKYWFGYKKHASVDMQSGLINKVNVTPANVADGNGFKEVSPEHGAVYMDKGYCGQTVEEIAKKKT